MTQAKRKPSAEHIYSARDIAHVFEQIAPIELGNPGDQLGFIYGSPDTPVSGIGCLWNIHRKSLEVAVENELNMLICHEQIWLKPQTTPWYNGPTENQIRPNQMRRELLDKHRIVVYRSHSNWDALPVDGVADQAVAALGIPNLKAVDEQKYFKVLEFHEPMTVTALMSQVEQGLGFHACRVFGDPMKKVSRFSFLIGGFGGNQHHMPQAAAEMGAEAIIIGEMDEFIVIGALEQGIPVIETLHSVSESPAIRRQAQILAKRFPDLKLMYIPSGALAFN
jgi:putative NIF3 family GTP cyclohydrolase 1 type 2